MAETLKNIFKDTEYFTDESLKNLNWKEDDYFGKYTTIVMDGKTIKTTNLKGTFSRSYDTGRRYKKDEVPILCGFTYLQPIKNIGILEKVKIIFKNNSEKEEEYTEETQNYFSWSGNKPGSLVRLISNDAIYLNFPFLNEKMKSVRSLTYNLQLPLYMLPYQGFNLYVDDSIKDLVDSVVFTHKNVSSCDTMDTIALPLNLGKPEKHLHFSGGVFNLRGF